MMEWQPIETAPKDGSEIVVAAFDEGKMLWWHKAWRGGYYWNVRGGACKPTHWLPFPKPPKSA